MKAFSGTNLEMDLYRRLAAVLPQLPRPELCSTMKAPDGRVWTTAEVDDAARAEMERLAPDAGWRWKRRVWNEGTRRWERTE